MAKISSTSWRKVKIQIIVAFGSTLVFLGVFACILLIATKDVYKKTVWLAVSLAGILVGWVIVRTQTNGSAASLKTILRDFISTILNPFG